MVPSITYTERRPLILIPLSLVMVTVLLKDGYEELSRYLKDREENNRSVEILDKGTFTGLASEDILIGDLVKIGKNEPFPCDVVLLQSSDSKGRCFVETKNLDGEANLKIKKVPSCEHNLQELTEGQLFQVRYELKYEKPNPHLNSFSGSICIEGEVLPLNN